MRKAAVMIGFGAFFLTMALLMRFYAYPKLAVVPLNQNTQQTVADDNAKYFDADKVKAGSGKILTKATVVADKAASEKVSKELGRDVVVIDQWQSTDNFDDKGQMKAPPMSATTQRVAIDRSTGEAVKWDGNELNGKPVDIKTVKQNDRFAVVLKVTEAKPEYGHIMVSDYLPAGLEIDNPHLVSSGDSGTLDWIEDGQEPVNTEFRDDRFTAALDRAADSKSVFTVAYVVRAVSPGKYVLPQAYVEDMYNPSRYGRTATGSVEVRAAK